MAAVVEWGQTHGMSGNTRLWLAGLGQTRNIAGREKGYACFNGIRQHGCQKDGCRWLNGVRHTAWVVTQGYGWLDWVRHRTSLVERRAMLVLMGSDTQHGCQKDGCRWLNGVRHTAWVVTQGYGWLDWVRRRTSLVERRAMLVLMGSDTAWVPERWLPLVEWGQTHGMSGKKGYGWLYGVRHRISVVKRRAMIVSMGPWVSEIIVLGQRFKHMPEYIANFWDFRTGPR